MSSRIAIAALLFVGMSAQAIAQFDPFEANKIELAKVEIAIMTKACDKYKSKTGAFPTKLTDLVDGGYVVLPEGKKKLLDPWGKEYEYDPKGSRNEGKTPDIWITRDKTEYGNWPKKEK
jgi:hypothetical protein